MLRLISAFAAEGSLSEKIEGFSDKIFLQHKEAEQRRHPLLSSPPTTLIMIYGRWWNAISKSIKHVFTLVLTSGTLHCLPAWQLICQVPIQAADCLSYPSITRGDFCRKNTTKSFFGCSKIHLRGNWQASAASGHLCLPHLNIASGIYSVSSHNNFRNAPGVSFEALWGILSLLLDSKFHQKV